MSYQTNVGMVRGRFAAPRAKAEDAGSKMRRLISRLRVERRPAVRERLASELDRIFRAAYRLRMKG